MAIELHQFFMTAALEDTAAFAIIIDHHNLAGHAHGGKACEIRMSMRFSLSLRKCSKMLGSRSGGTHGSSDIWGQSMLN